MRTGTAPQRFTRSESLISDQYVDRVTESGPLRGSSSLPRLLRYLAERAREEPGENIKEFRIATEVLGRGEDFDSRTDSVVRVTTARLRAKLDEYYAGEGASDTIRLHVPKGHYRLMALPAPPPPPSAPPVAQSRPPVAPWVRVAALAGVAALLAAASYQAGSRSGPPRQPPPEPELARFWSELGGPEKRIRVVYSNVPHGVTSYGRLAAVQDPESGVQDDWHTGVGEVEAAMRLAKLSAGLELDLELKRALLVDWDEVLGVNVVYLGGPGANPQVAELGKEANFVFEAQPAEDGGSQFVIRNRSPRSGERSVYAAEMPLEKDYAVVRLTRGFRSDRWILLLAGITTFGTAAAAEFVSDADLLESSRLALGRDLSDPVAPFECVVELGLKENVPFETRVTACRPLETQVAP